MQERAIKKDRAIFLLMTSTPKLEDDPETWRQRIARLANAQNIAQTRDPKPAQLHSSGTRCGSVWTALQGCAARPPSNHAVTGFDRLRVDVLQRPIELTGVFGRAWIRSLARRPHSARRRRSAARASAGGSRGVARLTVHVYCPKCQRSAQARRGAGYCVRVGAAVM